MTRERTACQLHIPHKRWAYGTDRADPQYEEDNYRYLENWSVRFAACFPGEAVPVAEPILWGEPTIFDYYNPIIGPAPGSDEPIHYAPARFGLSWAAPPTGDVYTGPGVSYTWSPVFAPGDTMLWLCPALADFYVEVNFWFSETLGSAPSAAITRGLRIRANVDSTGVDAFNEYQTFTGTRLETRANMRVGPYTITERFTLFTYCNWDSVVGSYPIQSHNTYPGPDHGILVEGVFL